MFDPGEFGRSTGKWIHRHNIFRIVISDEGKIAELTIDSFLVVKMISRLNIDFILTLTGYEINFSFLQYPDLYIKSLLQKVQIYYIFNDLFNILSKIEAT